MYFGIRTPIFYNVVLDRFGRTSYLMRFKVFQLGCKIGQLQKYQNDQINQKTQIVKNRPTKHTLSCHRTVPTNLS